MAHNQNGGRHGLFEITLQRFRILHVLCLLDNHHLPFRHHRITARSIGNLRGIHIGTEEDGLVKVTLLGLQHMLCDIVGNPIDIIRFITHQIIDRNVFPCLQIGHNRVETYIFCLSHCAISIIICTFALAKLVQIEQNTK